jgi:DNA-binding MarR family transcriptional regulator
VPGWVNGEKQPAVNDDVAALTSAVLNASRVLVAVSARSLAGVADRVTLPQFRLLVLLATHGEMTLGTLADMLGVNPSTAMRMADRLVGSECVGRRANPENRREVLLQLTRSGRVVVEQVTARRRAEIAAIVARMPAQDQEAMVTALHAFAEAGGEPPVSEPRQDHVPLGWD